MSYTIKFSYDDNPGIFYSFRNLIYDIRQDHELCDSEMIEFINTRYNIKLNTIQDINSLGYTAEFKDEQSYVFFLLKYNK